MLSDKHVVVIRFYNNIPQKNPYNENPKTYLNQTQQQSI